MKRSLAIILVLATLIGVVCVGSFADAPSAAATEVIEMIMELDENTTAQRFIQIKEAFKALSDEEKDSVWNKNKLESFEETFALAINTELEALDLLSLDLLHGQRTVDNLFARYNALEDSSKALVTNYDKLLSASEKIENIRKWVEDKDVMILNSTLHALSGYDLEYIASLAERDVKGLYYYFEEVGMLEADDTSTGYYDIEDNNQFVHDQKYVKLVCEIKFTDLDFEFGWPAFKNLVSNSESSYWSAFDFVNNVYLTSEITKWSQGMFVRHRAMGSGNIDLGVWHHFVIEWDDEKITYEMDGETVFETAYTGDYDFYLIYPWACNLEMCNVHYIDKFGKDVLSPFRNAVNYPSGWSKTTVEVGTKTMLDFAEEALADTRNAYNKLSDEQKERVIGADQIERVQALIDKVRSGKFDITVNDGSAGVERAAFNEKVTVTAADAPEGKVFDRWIVDPELVLLAEVDPVEIPADLTKAELTFAMPDADLTLTATYKDKPDVEVGDANGDGKINAKDVTSIMKYLVGAAPKNFVEAAADYDGSGKINAKDVTKLMKFLVS